MDDALAAHRAVLALRESIAAEPEADFRMKADVGRSLVSVARLLEAVGRQDEALAAYRRSERFLSSLKGSDTEARAALAHCQSSMGRLLAMTGKINEALAAYRLA